MDSPKTSQPAPAPYPRLNVRLDIVERNTLAIARQCSVRGIRVTGVVKGIGALPPVAAAMVRGGCKALATSRISHLQSLRVAALDPGSGIPTDVELGMLRVPSPTEMADLVALADWSLQSDPDALELANRISLARSANLKDDASSGTGSSGTRTRTRTPAKRHGVVIMVDLGDLREGWFDLDEAFEAALRVERGMPGLYLRGVGTNLGCYGSVLPDADNLGQLVSLARRIEKAIGRPLDVVSGGATSSLRSLVEGSMPDGITELRVGEGILTALDLPHFHGVSVPGVSGDALRLQAEVIEVRRKPSMPVGKRLVDAFGNVVQYEDRGEQTRLLLNVGKRDIGSHELLIPEDPRIRVIGSSSDHLICEVDGQAPLYGDIASFRLLYGAMLFLSDDNPYVSVVYVD